MILTSSREQKLSPGESQWHDVVRLVLVSQVVLGHIAAIALPAIPEMLGELGQSWPYVLYRVVWRFGPEAAYLFVFLSGYMVGGPLVSSLRSGMSFPQARSFFIKRLMRIVPIAVGAVLITALVDYASRMLPGAEAFYRTTESYDMIASYNVWSFVGNLLFLQPVFADSFGSNGPLWTLGYIVQFYVIGWVIFRTVKFNRVIGISVFAAAIVLMAVVRPEWAVLFGSWVAGGLARQFQVTSAVRIPLLIVALLLFAASNFAGPLLAAGLSIPVGVLLTLALRNFPPTPRLQRSVVLRRVSADSFTIYAVHFPLLLSISVTFFNGTRSATPLFWLYLLVALCVVVQVSWGLTRLVGIVLPRKVAAA